MTATITNLVKLPRNADARAGVTDRDAFEKLYKEFAPFAYSVLRRHLGDSPHIEDLLQKVFVKVYRELPEFKGDRPFRGWLSNACCFTVYDHLRRERRHEAVSFDDVDNSAALEAAINAKGSWDQGPERAFIEAEIVRRTRVVLDNLSPEKRMALVMCDFEGYSLKDAADILGTAKFTLRTRLVRARKEFARRAAKDEQLVQLIERGERS